MDEVADTLNFLIETRNKDFEGMGAAVVIAHEVIVTTHEIYCDGLRISSGAANRI